MKARFFGRWIKIFPEMHSQQWIFLSLLVFGMVAVVSGYALLSYTDDELYHISCGMQWLREGKYTRQPLHPPLGRVMDALLLYFYNSHVALINFAKAGHYVLNMVLSRVTNLPFYVLSCVIVYAWSKRLYGASAALWAMALYVTLSSVTAHAMLATTDMQYTGLFLWGLYMSVLWLEMPSMRRSFWVGVSLGLMAGAKFSGFMHWPVSFLAITLLAMAGRWGRGKAVLPFNRDHYFNGFFIVLPCFVFVLWLIFLCDFTSLFTGLRDARGMDRHGFGVWFYGPMDRGSNWLFFPTVFFFKTPLPFLAAACMAALICVYRVVKGRGEVALLFPLVAAAAVMLSSMTSNINLGVRHVLPVYGLLAIPAGYGLWRLWQAALWGRAVAALLILCQLVGFCMYQPEHIAYFNIAAGEQPERISLDSDFDWGQSMLMLGAELEKRSIKEYYLCVRKDAVWNSQFTVHARRLDCPTQREVGWVAVSRAWKLLHADNFAWLSEDQKVERIGKTMDLYYFPPVPARQPAPEKPLVLKPVSPRQLANEILANPLIRPLVVEPNISRTRGRPPTLSPRQP